MMVEVMVEIAAPRHTAHSRHFHTVTRLPLFQLVQVQQLRTSSAASGQQSLNEVQASSQ